MDKLAMRFSSSSVAFEVFVIFVNLEQNKFIVKFLNICKKRSFLVFLVLFRTRTALFGDELKHFLDARSRIRHTLREAIHIWTSHRAVVVVLTGRVDRERGRSGQRRGRRGRRGRIVAYVGCQLLLLLLLLFVIMASLNGVLVGEYDLGRVELI